MAHPSPVDLTAAITHNPPTIGPDSLVMDAISLMSGVRTLCPIDRDHTAEDGLPPETRSSCVVVVDDDQVVGLLTERDVVRLAAQQRPLDQLLVAEVMTQPVITRRQSDLADLFSTIDLLHNHHIRHLPIVDEQHRLVGLITHESLRQLTRPVDLLRLRLVQEVITKDVLCASPDSDMLDIARLMVERQVSSVVIVVPGGSAEDPFHRAVGLLTERDLVQFQALGLSLAETTAQAVMSSPLFTVALETSLWTVQQVMDQHRIRRVVVAGEQGELLGVVTQTSLLQAFNPVELYQLAEVLEQKVVQLETERITLLQHLTESNQAIRMQAEIDRLLQGFALATTHLMTLQDGHESVQAALDALGSALRVDRSYIFENHPHPNTGEMALSQRWEWVAEGVTPQMDNPELQNISFAEIIPSWYQTLDRGQTVVGLVKDFPETEQAHLAPQGIVSILLVPIFIQDYFWGLVGFDDCREERVWENSTQSALKAIAGTIGSAIARRRAEANATSLTQRLQEAQRIAKLGVWELDLRTNSLYWSKENFRIFEIDSQQFGASYAAFLDLVHPDDRPLVENAYNNHLRDHQPYRLVHRLQMPDGRIKYVQEQCETTYSADGNPLISQGTVQDITQQHVAELHRDRAEAALRQVIEGTAAVTGAAFFPALVRHISAALGVRYVSIDQAMADGFQSLAFFANGNFSIPLFLPYEELPCCLKSFQAGSCCHPAGVQALYPGNTLLTDLQVDSYLGVGLHNAAGDPIGNLYLFHDAPLADPDWAQTLLSIFAARAGAELERLLVVQDLEALNTKLEMRVTQRTTELTEREAFLQDFLDNANDLIQIVDIDTGHFEFVNEAWRDVLGYTAAEVDRLTIYDILAPDCLNYCQHVMEQMGAGTLTNLKQVELTFVHQSGRPVLLEGSLNCRYGVSVDGYLPTLSIRAIFRDITARKVAEQELQRREARYRALLEGASDAILLANTEGYLIEVNPQAMALMGYDRHELVGMHFSQIHPPEALAIVAEAFGSLVQGGRFEALNLEILRQDGQRVPVDITGSVIEVGGEIIIQGIFHDLRERLQAEQTLRESEIRFRRVFESNVVGMMFTDFSGQITDANDRFLEIIGYSRANLAADDINWAQITPPEYVESDQRAIKQLQHYGEILPWEKEYLRPDGSRVSVLIGVALISKTDGRCVCVVLDITDRKQAEQTMRQQAERETVLREITQRIRESLDLQTIFDTACEEIRACFRADRVGIFKFYPDSGYNDGEFVTESVVHGFPSVVAIRVHDHCFGENYASLYAQGRYYVVDDIYHNGLETCHTDILAQFQVQANLVMPLLCNHQLWGLLCIHQCDSPRHWHQSEIDLGQQLANQLAIAIQQAMLYEQLQSELQERQRAEATIIQQLRQQTALELILRQIRQSLDLPEILAIATQQVQELLHSDRVIVFQVYHHGHSRIVEEAVAPDLPRLRAMQWEDETWSQNILEHYWQGKPRIVPDVMDDIWTNCLMDYSQAGQIQSKIVAPILQELCSAESHRWVSPESNKLWGVLVVHACHTRRVWQPEEAQLLQQVANQLAIAIQQASLVGQLQQELTERQQAQQQLTLTNQELIRATRLKDEFLANMSHELRTPLNAILGMTEALQEEDVFGPVNAQQINALKTVERSGDHLLALINDVLDVAKIEAGKLDLDCHPTAIAPLCQSSLAFIKQPALKKGLRLTVTLPPNVPEITLDERRIRQVLINLLNNAVKFTPAGGRITLDVSLLPPPQIHPETPYLRLAVTDTGIGIPTAVQPRLFQPFVQVDSALNRQYQGTGLGLALVKRIVDLHGGQVSLTSEVGVGSCFTIDLPCGAVITSPSALPTSPAATKTPPPMAVPTPATQPLILLVEDNQANIITLMNYLQAKGYRVDIAHNGEAALEQAQHRVPALILMDIQIPNMDGLKVIGHLRRIPSLAEVPVIALTSLAIPGERDRCMAAGATDYFFTKPVRLNQLVERIHTLLTT